MSIKVVDNKAILKDEHKKICLLIYKIKNNEIYLTETFKVIYNYFWHILPRHPHPDCGTLQGYVIPLNPVTTFSGVTDQQSGYVNFKSITPISPNNSIINEGIALRSFREGYGNSVYFKFEYEIFGVEDNEKIDVYILRSNSDKISLFIDTNMNVSTYHGKKVSFVSPWHNLFYFRYTGQGMVNLTVTAIPPESIPPCINDEIKCLKIKYNGKTYKSPLFRYIRSTIGSFETVPEKQWSDIFDLVQKRNLNSRRPIPLTPIITNQPAIDLIVDSKYGFNTSGNPVMIPDYPPPPYNLYLPALSSFGNEDPSEYYLYGSLLRGSKATNVINYYPHAIVFDQDTYSRPARGWDWYVVPVTFFKDFNGDIQSMKFNSNVPEMGFVVNIHIPPNPLGVGTKTMTFYPIYYDSIWSYPYIENEKETVTYDQNMGLTLTKRYNIVYNVGNISVLFYYPNADTDAVFYTMELTYVPI